MPYNTNVSTPARQGSPLSMRMRMRMRMDAQVRLTPPLPRNSSSPRSRGAGSRTRHEMIPCDCCVRVSRWRQARLSVKRTRQSGFLFQPRGSELTQMRLLGHMRTLDDAQAWPACKAAALCGGRRQRELGVLLPGCSRMPLQWVDSRAEPCSLAKLKQVRGAPTPSVLGYWVGVRRLFHIDIFLTASRMVLPQDPSTEKRTGGTCDAPACREADRLASESSIFARAVQCEP